MSNWKFISAGVAGFAAIAIGATVLILASLDSQTPSTSLASGPSQETVLPSSTKVTLKASVPTALGGQDTDENQGPTPSNPEVHPDASATATREPSGDKAPLPELPVQEATALEADTPLQSSRAVDVDPRQFRQLLPRDAIAPIYRPKAVLATEADLDPNELVIGVEIGGESRAYPIGPLARREMVNDVVGGVPLLVTW